MLVLKMQSLVCVEYAVECQILFSVLNAAWAFRADKNAGRSKVRYIFVPSSQGWDSIVGIETCCGLYSSGIESQWGVGVFCTCPD